MGEPGDGPEPGRFFLEDGDELPANTPALFLGIGHAAQALQEACPGFPVDEIDHEGIAERVHNGMRLALAEQTVVDEDARELISDRAVHEDRHHRRVHPTRQGTQHAAITHPGADVRDRGVDERRHRPGPGYLAAVQEVLEDTTPLGRVRYFGMELHGVESAFIVGHRGHRAVVGGGKDREPGRGCQHCIAVAHPNDQPTVVGGDATEERAGSVQLNDCLAVLTSVDGHHAASEPVGHDLHPIANPEDRHPQLEQSGGGHRRLLFIHAGRAAREDDALVVGGAEALQGNGGGQDFRVYRHLADAAGDQLRILRTVVENRDRVDGAHPRALHRSSAGVRVSGPAGRLCPLS